MLTSGQQSPSSQGTLLAPSALTLFCAVLLPLSVLLPQDTLPLHRHPPPFLVQIFLCLQRAEVFIIFRTRRGKVPIPTKLPFVLLLLRNHPDLLRLAHLDCLKECSVFPSAIALSPKVLPSGFCLWFPSAPAVSHVPGTVRFFKAVTLLSRLVFLQTLLLCLHRRLLFMLPSPA